jgi:hypothetical protein
MTASGSNRAGLVAALELLAAARAQEPSIDELIELVTTGPEAGTVTNRDTQVVVQDLFRNAERSILVAGYELYLAEAVFRTLADLSVAAKKGTSLAGKREPLVWLRNARREPAVVISERGLCLSM